MLSTAIPVSGGVSIKGGRPGQAGVQLGTTTLVDPASGVAQVPLPDGAIESVTVLPNPYAVEYGRFSSGLIVIQSRRARDQWKFRAHRFAPSLRSRSDGGLRIDSFNPRMEVGGPLVKDRVYVEQSAQARYNIGDLAGRPETEQRVTKALSSFTRVDANVSPKHSVVGTIGMFPNAADFANLNTFVGPEASVNLRILGKQLSLTERALWTNRTAAETTFQWFQSRTDVDPQGTAPMELQPDITLGNFFNRQHRTTSSYQVVHVVTGHRDGFGGSHVFKAGVDLLHTRYDGTSQSQTVLIERADGTVARRLDFSGASVQTIGGTEAAVFVQDRLQPHPRWYVETGLRLDRDGVLGHVNLSPRIGTAVLLTESGNVVMRGGWGLFVERTPSMAGAFTSFESAVDTRFPTDAASAVSPGVPVTHTVAPVLETPVGRTWDAAFDYRWNTRWAFHVGVLYREGRHESIVTPLVADTRDRAAAVEQRAFQLSRRRARRALHTRRDGGRRHDVHAVAVGGGFEHADGLVRQRAGADHRREHVRAARHRRAASSLHPRPRGPEAEMAAARRLQLALGPAVLDCERDARLRRTAQRAPLSDLPAARPRPGAPDQDPEVSAVGRRSPEQRPGDIPAGRGAKQHRLAGLRDVLQLRVAPRSVRGAIRTLDQEATRVEELLVRLVSTNRELEAAFEGQGHGAQPVARIVDEFEVLAVCLAKLQRVVADDDRALAQMRRDQSERRPSHRRPDVDEHEVDRPLHIHEGFSEIPFAEVDEIGQAGFGKMAARHPGLLRLMLGADHDRTAASVECACAPCRRLSRTAAARKSVETPNDVPASTTRRARSARHT